MLVNLSSITNKIKLNNQYYFHASRFYVFSFNGLGWYQKTINYFYILEQQKYRTYTCQEK